jgi:glucose uptake protein GlcU
MTNSENVSPADESADKTEVVSAGAFDIRSIIGGLLGLYGLILVVVGLWFTEASDKVKADGENLNLIVGIGLLVAAAFFIVWVVLRPLKVPVPEE